MIEHHSLEGEAFQKALERYVDENKPDQLVLKQIQGWDMQWSSSSESSSTEPNVELSFTPTDQLQGSLTWKNEYMMAEIECLCCWEPPEKGTKLSGSLYFSMQAQLRVRNKHDKNNNNNADEEKKPKAEKKAQEKIRSKMIQRLKEDAYIKRLSPDKDSKKKSILCEARVNVSSEGGQLEERVDVTDNVAEGLRRALFSQAESALDVVELLLSLPLLPGSAHALTSIHCPLADRAKLRLLEDAMFDACEREGEDELIDELKISTNDKESNVESAEQQQEEGSRQKHFKGQPNRSNKRTKR